MRSRLWLIFDCSMLVTIVALQAWRLTGVPLREWLAVALIVPIVAHLLLHWSWIETRTRRILAPRTVRTRINYALNFVLFLGIVGAMISGFMISKSALPMHPTADSYLKWHSIHETSSRVALACVGSHLALNWNVLFAQRPQFRFRPLIGRVAAIVIAVAVVAGTIYGLELAIPRPDITFIAPDGRVTEHATPTPDIAELRRDEVRPSTRGVA